VETRRWVYGESCPRVPDQTTAGTDLPAARRLNRRVVVTISRGPGAEPLVAQMCLRGRPAAPD
jgi:hypothetical protein